MPDKVKKGKKKSNSIPYFEVINLASLDIPARIICKILEEEYGVQYRLEACGKYIWSHKEQIEERKKEIQSALNTLPFASKASRVNLIGTKIKRLMENDDKLLLDYLKAMKDEMEGFETPDGKDDPLLKLADAILESRRR